MEFNIKGMSYSLLLSHTFPGLLFGLQILLAFALYTKFNVITFLSSQENNAINLVSFLTVTFVFSTLLGFIVDGVHHFIFEDFLNIILKRKDSCCNMKLFQFIKTNQQAQIYRVFLLDDYWYPYEAYANIGISMMPGLILLPHWLYHLQITTWFNITITFVYWLICFIMSYEAIITLQVFREAEDKLIENFQKNYINSTDKEQKR
jgi:hypothetical protein